MRRLGPALLLIAATLLFVAPLLRHFASAYPHDAGDPSLNAWILWWSTRRLPLTDAWWNAPMFYPMHGALALSEVLVGILPITMPVQALTGNPLAAYNVAFLLTFPLCGLAMSALARDLTDDRTAAIIAGVAYAFSPYRMSQLGHLQMLAYYGAPIALLGLHRFYNTTQTKWLCVFGAGWLVQSLSNGYAMFHLAVFIALWLLWFARSRRVALPILVTWIAASVPLVPILLKYQAIHSALRLTRDINEIRNLGIDVADLFRSSPDLLIWHRLLPGAGVEVAAFPGITVVVIGLVGLTSWWPRRSARERRPGSERRLTLDRIALSAIAAVAIGATLIRDVIGPWHLGPLSVTDPRKPFSIAVLALAVLLFRTRPVRHAAETRSVSAFYLLGLCAMWVLALGPAPKLLGTPFLYRPPYEWLMALPGFNTLRVPARFLALGTLCTSVLLAFVIARVSVNRSRRRLIITVTAIGLVVDGAAHLSVQAAPSRGPTWSNVDAVIELPAGRLADFAAIHRGMVHGFPIVNGYSGYFPPHYLPLLYALDHGHLDVLQEFPSPRGIAVSIDRSNANALAMSSALRDTPGSTHLGISDRLDTFLLRTTPRPPTRTGAPLRLAAVEANRMPEDALRMVDGRIDTGWHAGPSQIGDEEVIADLGSDRAVGAISIGMGPFAFGFPRQLEVDLSSDQHIWRRAWSGATDVLTVRGALQSADVPITIVIGPARARYVRLRQSGRDAAVPWWIGELAVFAPAGT
jgi:hypothetical protein